MASRFVIRSNQYYDSVFLMRISKRISESTGVQQNAVLMGTETNKTLLANIGVSDPRITTAKPTDLIVAVVADTQQNIDDVMVKLDDFLLGGLQGAVQSKIHSFEDGLAQKPDASLVAISVPGEYAAREARKALEAGLSVFLFSDNVSIEDELELKQQAIKNNLLVMGPDCGTSIINGVSIGFANAVRKGSIGAIGASGTGLQEFTTQVHNTGFGISHAIGTGSRDLSDKVGGLTTLAALNILENDPATNVIAVISKPPGAATLAKLASRIKTCKKPVIGCFLGNRDTIDAGKSFHRSGSINEAVGLAISEISGGPAQPHGRFTEAEMAIIKREAGAWSLQQRYIRGLFAGGTFCYQSQQVFRDCGITTWSNTPLDPRQKLPDPDKSMDHSLVDMGDDHYTLGKPHPMIDGTVRHQRILAEGRDPQVAVLFLDFILGYGASADPAGELLDSLVMAKKLAHDRGGYLSVVASICGTADDPQDLTMQSQKLQEQGVIVFNSNARAAAFCCQLISQKRGEHHAN